MAYPRCIHGHALTDENFRVSESGRKRCRKCESISSKKWRKKNRKHMREYLNAWRAERRKKK